MTTILLLLCIACVSLFLGNNVAAFPGFESAPSLSSSFFTPPQLRGLSQSAITYNGDWADSDDLTVFVAIAAWRDVECTQTVRDLYHKAANPRRVFLGIIEQNEHGDPHCIPPEFFHCRSADFCPIDNIRRRRVVSRKGSGPTYGRHVSSLEYRGEAIYIMIDSHNEFLLAWDRQAITQLWRARSPRPITSFYPNGWDKNGQSYESQGQLMAMCKGIFVEHLGYVRNGARWVPRAIEPRPQPFTAAGYLAGDARFMHDVPFDPFLNKIFDGEEMLVTARLWDRGWDAFSPGLSIVFHDYNRHTAPRYFGNARHDPGFHHEMQVSQQRAQFILQVVKKGVDGLFHHLVHRETAPKRVLERLDLYGLSEPPMHNRTLMMLYQMGDVDMKRRKAGEGYCDYLGRLDRKSVLAPVH